MLREDPQSHEPITQEPAGQSVPVSLPTNADLSSTQGTSETVEGAGDAVPSFSNLGEQEDSIKAAAHEALSEFFGKLQLSESDQHNLFEKRGLTTVTVQALCFRSNPRSNQQLLEQLVEIRGWPLMIAAGLALPADRARKLHERINSQYCGKGQIRIPRAERTKPDIKSQWDLTEPVLIPYFDVNRSLGALRPHKGGAPTGTVASGKSLYIPRAFQPPFDEPEQFGTVVITEGEFKAAALWQTVGIGAGQFKADAVAQSGVKPTYGVCAVPGISYAKTAKTRAVLEDWIRSTNCGRIIVAFDHEQKGDSTLASYEPNPDRRYDTYIYARYLAVDLARTLHLQARVCVLPDSWMNAGGKADFDGALAALIQKHTR